MYKLHTRKQELYFDEVIRLHYEKGYGEDRISRIIPVGHTTVNRWIRIFAAGKETERRIMPGTETERRIMPGTETKEKKASPESDTVTKAEYERLKAKLEMAEIKAEAYEELIRVAEEKFKIQIRKKAGARR